MRKNYYKKGRELEKWVSERLRHTGLDPYARPEIGSGSGRFKGDITTKLPITFECKNTANFQAKKFLKQAEDASMGYQEAVVIWHPNGVPMENSKVFMSWSLFETLMKSLFKDNTK
jgi:hypothetical protein